LGAARRRAQPLRLRWIGPRTQGERGKDKRRDVAPLRARARDRRRRDAEAWAASQRRALSTETLGAAPLQNGL